MAVARVTAATAGAPAQGVAVAGGAKVTVVTVLGVVPVAAVVGCPCACRRHRPLRRRELGMRAAVGMAAHGTTAARGRIGTVVATADRATQ